MIFQEEFTLPAFPRGFHLITNHVLELLAKGLRAKGHNIAEKKGFLHIYIKHTSAGLTVNENADTDVRIDFESFFNKIVPENEPYLVHTIEGPDDMPAHVKSSLVGSSVTIPLTSGRLNLGTWQGVFLCEFRNQGGRRKIVMTLYCD